MEKFLIKLFTFITPIVFSILPAVSFAQTGGGLSVAWADPVTTSVNQDQTFTTTFSLTVSNMQNPSNLLVFVFADDNQDFNPASLMLAVGTPPANGQINFTSSTSTASFDMGPGSYFLPVVVDSASYVGGMFDPYQDSADFQTFELGQVAQSTSSGTNPTTPGTNPTTPGTNPGGAYPNVTGVVNNPLGATFELTTFFQSLVSLLMKIAIPVLIMFFIFSGFRFVKAIGNTKELESAKENFKYVMIGAAIVLGFWVIVKVIEGTVDQFTAMNDLLISFINLV